MDQSCLSIFIILHTKLNDFVSHDGILSLAGNRQDIVHINIHLSIKGPQQPHGFPYFGTTTVLEVQ